MPREPGDPPKPSYFTGLDLGLAADFTALAVLEKTAGPDTDPAGNPITRYSVRHLRRWQLGSAYPDIVRELRDGLFADERLERTTLVADATGVGRAVVQMIQRERVRAALVPLTITGGHRAHQDEHGDWMVPKKDLVAVMQTLLQTRRLAISRELPEAELLEKELANFQVKITPAANEIYGAWREGQHDDLVLAVAIAAWMGERSFSNGGWIVPDHLAQPSGPTRTYMGVDLSERPGFFMGVPIHQGRMGGFLGGEDPGRSRDNLWR